MKLKFAGALFIYLNTIGFCVLSALPLFNVLFGLSFWSVCLAEGIVMVLIGTYAWTYKG
jgi:hypothetical protein